MRDSLRPDDRLGAGTVALALLAGGLAAAAAHFFCIPGVDPSMWRELAVAAGLRPPDSVLPGLWRILCAAAVGSFGVDGAVRLLGWLGTAAAGLSTALVYLIARQLLAFLYRGEGRYAAWCRFLAPFFSFLAALTFAAGDPLGRIGGTLPSEGIHLVLFLASVHFTLRWFAAGGTARILAAAVLTGVLAAETPLGLALPAVFPFVCVAAWRCVVDGIFEPPPALRGLTEDDEVPVVELVPKWKVIVVFLLSFLAVAAADTAAYAAAKGGDFDGWRFAELYIAWGRGWIGSLSGMATPIGWVLGLGLCALPFFVTAQTLPLLVRDDGRLPFGPGLLLGLAGAVTLLQGGTFISTCFWKFSPEEAGVGGDFLLALFVAASVLTTFLAGAAFAFACRGVPVAGVAACVSFAAFAALSLRSLPKPTEAAMRAVVDDAVAETVRECEGAKWIFTDGLVDDALRLEAQRRGVELHPLDMMGGLGDGEQERIAKLLGGAENLRSLSLGVPMLLRTWAGEKSHGLDEAAVQLGFDFWRREGKEPPEASGLVARTAWPRAGFAAEGVARAEAIGRRILALADGVRRSDPPRALMDAYAAVAWRISRFARMRGDVELADGLDKDNAALRQLADAIVQERTKTFTQFTPREGLALALRKADFTMAATYANLVLDVDEDSAEANFAMGMAALVRGRMDDAEMYLRKCLRLRPEEPAVLNNLSIICRKSCRFDEAVRLAEQAAKLAPDNREVQKTLADAKAKKP